MLEDVEEIPVILKHMCMYFPVLLYKQIVIIWADHSRSCKYMDFGGVGKED